ncbi:glycosyltransferase family 2 protein [Novosphingobium resinovorum]|nr:glycosyltransferase family 2 protein [Novosphingobium resinovorum]
MTLPRHLSPIISVLMVARNAARFIDAALRSARAQTLRQIEIVVVDDGSIDETASIVRSHAKVDGRVRLVAGPSRGLGAVRNVSIASARGRFAAVLDADDLLHPDHLEALLALQAATGAAICASNMVAFSQAARGITASAFAAGQEWQCRREIALDEYIRCGMIGTRNVSLGYLKPLFDMRFLRDFNIAYDERLRVGEDFDLVLRAMLAGGRFHFSPQTTYYYRRHAQSTSHRLAQSDLRGLMAAARDYMLHRPDLELLLGGRIDNLEGARRQIGALEALRAGRMLTALRCVGRHPGARDLLLSSLRESCLKRLGLWDDGDRNAADRAGCPAVPGNHLTALRRLLQPAPSPF